MREGAILRAERGRPSTYQDIPGGRYTQSDLAEVEQVRCGCRLGYTTWRCTWRQLANTTLNRPCAVAMRPYVKLLW